MMQDRQTAPWLTSVYTTIAMSYATTSPAAMLEATRLSRIASIGVANDMPATTARD